MIVSNGPVLVNPRVGSVESVGSILKQKKVIIKLFLYKGN